MREGERPAREQLSLMENEQRGEEQRLDAAVREHEGRVAQCTAEHGKLHEYASRLAEGASASRTQMMADCAARHAADEQLVTRKRDELRAVKAQREALNEKIQGQDKLTMQMRANLQVCVPTPAARRPLHDSR